MRSVRVLPLAAIFGLLITPVEVWSQEAQTPPPTVPSGITPLAENPRFDGYLFRDADLHPLPFQSDGDIENYLNSASVVSVTRIPVGVSRPTKVLLAGDALRIHAVFKNIDDEKRNVRDPTTTGRGKLYLIWRDSYIYDVAAYRIDRLLGLDRMAPIVVRKIKGEKGSLQIWVEGTITENDRRKSGYEPPEIARFNQQRETLQLFDNLIANRDANLGNTLIDESWRLWFIDCSRCFGTSDDLLYPSVIQHCDRRLWDALKKLDRAEADEALSPFLSRSEIDALFKRRDKIVNLLQSLIDEWGEEIVIYDERPPTDSAPWAGK